MVMRSQRPLPNCGAVVEPCNDCRQRGPERNDPQQEVYNRANVVEGDEADRSASWPKARRDRSDQELRAIALNESMLGEIVATPRFGSTRWSLCRLAASARDRVRRD